MNNKVFACVISCCVVCVLLVGDAVSTNCFAATAVAMRQGSWTLARLPNTPNFARAFPIAFHGQAQSINDHQQRHQIQDAMYLGDENRRAAETRTSRPQCGGSEFALARRDGQAYVTCEGDYPEHLQGIATDGKGSIYWSFTTKLVKSDMAGKLLKAVDAIDHHGDLTFAKGKIYVAVNDRVSRPPGKFNKPSPNNSRRQWIFEYDADLGYVGRHAVPQLVYGAGGLTYCNNCFWVVGGLPKLSEAEKDRAREDKNYLYEYDSSFRFVRTHKLATGNTDRGIQTAEFGAAKWWFGTYETDPRHSAGSRPQPWRRQVYAFDEALSEFTRFGLNPIEEPATPYPDGSVGIAALPDGRFLIAGNSRADGAYRGHIWLAEVDQDGHLAILTTIPDSDRAKCDATESSTHAPGGDKP